MYDTESEVEFSESSVSHAVNIEESDEGPMILLTENSAFGGMAMRFSREQAERIGRYLLYASKSY